MPVSSPVDRDRAREIRFHCARRLTIDVKQVGRELGVRYVLEAACGGRAAKFG
jgi:TolB-like protein